MPGCFEFVQGSKDGVAETDKDIMDICEGKNTIAT